MGNKQDIVSDNTVRLKVISAVEEEFLGENLEYFPVSSICV